VRSTPKCETKRVFKILRGQGGAGIREKRGRKEYGREEKRRQEDAGFPMYREERELRKKLLNIALLNIASDVTETGINVHGKQEVWTPPPSPPPPPINNI